MSTPSVSTTTTTAFLAQCIVAFAVSFIATVVGIW